MNGTSPMDPFRPCWPHPGMPPAFRASRPRARGYAACKDLQSIIVHTHQLKDLFHRLRGPPSPCAGLRRLQGLAVGDCSYPSVHGPLPALRATFSVRGEDLGLVQMASPWGKLSAQLTEGVTASSNLPFPCKSKYTRNLVHGPLSALRATFPVRGDSLRLVQWGG